jgi:signal transduction histidine kinase
MLTESTPMDPEIRKFMKKPEVLSSLSLPLRVRNQIIGVLNLSRMHGGDPFQIGDLEMATVFAGQAAMAIDQARLFDQLKLLSRTSQKLASAGDLKEAIAVILDAPRQLVHARDVTLSLAEGTIQAALLQAHEFGDHAQVLSRERMMVELSSRAENGLVTVPVLHSERVLGALRVQLPSANPVSEEQLDVLRTLAHTAGAVIESHSLHAREMVAFREVDHAMRADLNLAQMLDRLLTEMVNSCEAEGGAIFLWDSDRNQIEPWVSLRWTGQVEWVRRVIDDARAQMFTIIEPTPQSVIGAPMMLGSHVEGAIVLMRPQPSGGFSARHVDSLSTLTSTATLIIRNVQLYARSEETAIVEERTRIAREIHDGLAQDLSYLVFKIGAAQKLATQGKERDLRKELDEISSQLRRDIRDLRHTIFALRPLDIETEGFLPALTKFVKEFGQASEVELQLNVRGDASHLPSKLETALFRLTQETLNNIRKHAKATHAWVELELDHPHMVALNVRDDGNGFDLEQASRAARGRGSVGLVQMRERAERAGGLFAIETAPGKGTRIRVELPVRTIEEK